MSTAHPLRRLPALALAGLLLAMAACGGSDDGGGGTGGGGGKVALRLGYFPNLTHASAVVANERGTFADKLGPGVKLKTQLFNAGPAAVEAIFSGAIDATYVGPNPAINAFTRSKGQAVRVVSGATSGGAALVVKPSVNGPADLKGKRLSTPQLGNTQDVALRTWLDGEGLKTDLQGKGDVSILPQENGQTLQAFQGGQIDGAWVPEPWATRLVLEGGGKILVDEAELWPGRRFATTLLMVRTEFLRQHPDVVRRLLDAQVETTAFLNSEPEQAKPIVNESLARLTGKALPARVVDAAWERLTFTDDPVAASLRTSAAHAKKLDLLDSDDLDGLFDLRLLNLALQGAGRPEVDQR